MKVAAVKTNKVLPGDNDIYKFLDDSLPEIQEGSVVAVTSKIVSIFEGRTVPLDQADKEELVKQEAALYYFPDSQDEEYIHHFTITKNTLIPASGIDESNAKGHYVLWPKDPQSSTNKIRDYLKKKYNLKNIGVIITDSTIFPSRWGTMGIVIGFSGFLPWKDYIGSKDLFGRVLKVSTSNIAGGLAATAVMVMGEGREQTPLAVIEDLPEVEFVEREPTKEELDTYYISPLKDQAFNTFFQAIDWQKGGGE